MNKVTQDDVDLCKFVYYSSRWLKTCLPTPVRELLLAGVVRYPGHNKCNFSQPFYFSYLSENVSARFCINLQTFELQVYSSREQAVMLSLESNRCLFMVFNGDNFVFVVLIIINMF